MVRLNGRYFYDALAQSGVGFSHTALFLYGEIFLRISYKSYAVVAAGRQLCYTEKKTGMAFHYKGGVL